jgi:hypothetical protein
MRNLKTATDEGITFGAASLAKSNDAQNGGQKIIYFVIKAVTGNRSFLGQISGAT